tara:strand:- start:26 stop:214 length:189 start_codon:yes stop_codon:yes gene_type:complete
MIHHFTPQTGTGRKSQAIKELQNAVRKITPRTGASITTRGTQIHSKGKASGGAGLNVVSRWL